MWIAVNVHRLDQFEFVSGIFPLARFWADELRRPTVVVTNQSGIGCGYFDLMEVRASTRFACTRDAVADDNIRWRG